MGAKPFPSAPCVARGGATAPTAMKLLSLHTLAPGLGTLAAGLGALQVLSTDYTRDRTLTVSVDATTRTEVVANDVTIDGEPIDRGGRGGEMGGGPSSSARSYAWTDTVVAHEKGAPKKVRRAFGTVSGSRVATARGEDRTIELESPFSDAVLLIDATESETKVEVVEGDAIPSEQLAVLEPALGLDRLVPSDDVAPGASWELEGADFLAAVGAKLEAQLFRRPAPAGEGERGRGEGGGRRGFRGGSGGGDLGVMESGDWTIKATLAEETEEVDGLECMLIEIDAEVSGELPEMGGPGGRGGRDRAFGAELPLADGAPRANTYEAEFEARLHWSVAEARPVRLVVEGVMTTVMDNEFETERGVMAMHREQKTTYATTIAVTAGKKGE